MMATTTPISSRRNRTCRRHRRIPPWLVLGVLVLSLPPLPSPLVVVVGASAEEAASSSAEPTSTHQADVEALARFKAAVTNAPDTILAEWRPGETDPCGLGGGEGARHWPGVVCRCGDLSAALAECDVGGDSSSTSTTTISVSPSGLAVSAAGPPSSSSSSSSSLRARVVGLDLSRAVASGGRGLAPLEGAAAAALDLRLLEALVYLDLSQNALEGPLPDLRAEWAPGLQWLIVSGNGRLNGSLPAALAGGGGGGGAVLRPRAALKGALLSGNDFWGEVPEAWCASSATFEVQDNPRLCGELVLCVCFFWCRCAGAGRSAFGPRSLAVGRRG